MPSTKAGKQREAPPFRQVVQLNLKGRTNRRTKGTIEEFGRIAKSKFDEMERSLAFNDVVAVNVKPRISAAHADHQQVF